MTGLLLTGNTSPSLTEGLTSLLLCLTLLFRSWRYRVLGESSRRFARFAASQGDFRDLCGEWERLARIDWVGHDGERLCAYTFRTCPRLPEALQECFQILEPKVLLVHLVPIKRLAETPVASFCQAPPQPHTTKKNRLTNPHTPFQKPSIPRPSPPATRSASPPFPPL